MNALLPDPEYATARKPLDFSDFGTAGGSGINGSVDHLGRIIALNNYHPDHGYVTFTTARPFPESERYNSSSVRRYRAELVSLEGCGYTFPTSPRGTETAMLESVIPRIRLIFADDTYAQCITFAVAGGAIQLWETHGPAPTPRWQGRVSLQRCAYTQITEGGPLAPVPAITHVSLNKGMLVVHNPALPQAIAVSGLPDGDLWIEEDGDSFQVALPGHAGNSTLVYGIGTTPEAALEQARRLASYDAHTLLDQQLAVWQDRWRNVPDSSLIRRGLSYGLAMGVTTNADKEDDSSICLLTDHMLLPLSWNRDAYYTARALLSWREEMRPFVRRHLLWMFEQAERINGVWGRCYLANGKIKDAAFQLDQQLFPLLELAEYVLETGDQQTYERLCGHIQPLMDTLLARRHPSSDGLLLPTEETPADDPIRFPYHLSSHLLLWRVLNILHQLEGDPHWLELAADTKASIWRHFVAERGGSRLFAYATDGETQHYFYHDANDLPLVLAPLWDLIDAADPIWLDTLKFAFSDNNVGGFYGGHLGSVHTPTAWTLGDLQALIAADLTGDEIGVSRAWEGLKRAAQWDGSLPEGYDAGSGAVVARHWFAWPNAATAWYALERRQRQLQPNLG